MVYSITDMLFSFIRHLEHEKRASAHTVLAYKKDLQQFADFLKATLDTDRLEDVGHAQIRAWIIDLVEQKLAAASVNRKIATLRSFYKFLLQAGKITKDPTSKLKTLKMPKRLPEFIQEEAMEKILEEMAFTTNFEGQRGKMVMEFLYATGVRLSELINLKWKDVDLTSDQVKVLGKRNKERMIPLTKALKRDISLYRDSFLESFRNLDREDYFIVTIHREPAYPMMIYRIVKKHLDFFAQTSKRSPHLLRHTFATHLLNKGADLNAVKDLLGHANLAATQVYTHNTTEKLKAVFDQAHPKA